MTQPTNKAFQHAGVAHIPKTGGNRFNLEEPSGKQPSVELPLTPEHCAEAQHRAPQTPLWEQHNCRHVALHEDTGGVANTKPLYDCANAYNSVRAQRKCLQKPAHDDQSIQVAGDCAQEWRPSKTPRGDNAREGPNR